MSDAPAPVPAVQVHHSGITPTVGRVVHVHWKERLGDQPRPADVVAVLPDGRIDVCIKLGLADPDLPSAIFGEPGMAGAFSPNGGRVNTLRLHIYSNGEQVPDGVPMPGAPGNEAWAEWMPYQVGQAAGSSALMALLQEVQTQVAHLRESRDSNVNTLATGLEAVVARIGPLETMQSSTVPDILTRLATCEQGILDVKENQTHRLLDNANKSAATPEQRVQALEAQMKLVSPNFKPGECPQPILPKPSEPA